jgi:hypothetical protein
MPNFTTNFNLPYPAGTDEPCDFAQQWCDFTQAIDGVFDTFQSAIDRTIPVVPAAILVQTVPTSIFNFSPLRFDTVLVDTAGMTDLDVDPFTITITRPGRYTVACFVEKPTTGFSLPRFTSIFAGPSFSAQSELLDRGAGILYYLNGFHAVETYAAGDQARLSFSVGSQQFWDITSSWLAVIWHSDTEVP